MRALPAVLAVATLSLCSAVQASFGITYLTGTPLHPQTAFQAMSRNGRYLAVQLQVADNETDMMSWTASSPNAYTPHGPIVSPAFMQGTAISNDGATIIGYGGPQPGDILPGVWTDQFHQISGLAPGATPFAIANDGVTIVGVDRDGSGNSIAFKDAGGNITHFAPKNINFGSTAVDISGDGKVITGTDPGAVYWDAAGEHSLPLPAGYFANISGISTTGKWIVGFMSKDGFTRQMFRYSPQWGIIPTGPVIISGTLTAKISDDGAVIETMAATSGAAVATIWTDWEGFEPLSSYLSAHGIDLSKHLIQTVAGLSADGTMLAGGSSNLMDGMAEAYQATIQPVVPSFSLTLNAPAIVGGNVDSGIVKFSSAAPADVTVLMASSYSGLTPFLVSVPKGSASGKFSFATPGVASAISTDIEATFAGVTHSAPLTIQPASFSSLTLVTSTIVGGNKASGHFVLNGKTPSSVVTGTLSSSDTTLASVPATVNFPKQSKTAVFAAITAGVAAKTSVTLKGVYRGVTKSVVLAIEPAALTQLKSSATSVKGGTSFDLTAILTGFAPPGGAKVFFTSSAPAAAPVSAYAFVSAGRASRVLGVKSKPVAAKVVVTFTATYAGVSKTVQVTVTP